MISMKTMTWSERLDRVEKAEQFTLEDQELSRKWVTCAVGEKRGKYREEEDYQLGYEGCPESTELLGLGARFCFAVDTNNMPSARNLYNEIQQYFEGGGT